MVSKLKWRHRFVGVVGTMYSGQNMIEWKKPDYSREELKEWLCNQEDFQFLYWQWAINGFDTNLKPSIDRINPNIGYRLDNLQLITNKENRTKNYYEMRMGFNNRVSKKVIRVEDNKEFNSLRIASRETGIHCSSISECCTGKRKTAGGFTWRYKIL